jgi:uncharacterized protein (DUF1499 family)
MNVQQQKRFLRLIRLICLSLSNAKPTTFSTVLVALCWIGATRGSKFAGTKPSTIGVRSGQLAPCPDTPNCVNSQSGNPLHRIKPIVYSSTPEQAMADLKTLIENLEQAKIITNTKNYLYIEFTSSFWGFVDDVEFLIDTNIQVIQVRSASRLGKSDLGVNRKRVEMIRTKFEQLQKLN